VLLQGDQQVRSVGGHRVGSRGAGTKGWEEYMLRLKAVRWVW
jgi:hypothetical protein